MSHLFKTKEGKSLKIRGPGFEIDYQGIEGTAYIRDTSYRGGMWVEKQHLHRLVEALKELESKLKEND